MVSLGKYTIAHGQEQQYLVYKHVYNVIAGPAILWSVSTCTNHVQSHNTNNNPLRWPNGLSLPPPPPHLGMRLENILVAINWSYVVYCYE